MKVQTKVIVFSSLVLMLVVITSLLVVRHYLEGILDKRFEHRLTTISQLTLTASALVDTKQNAHYIQSLDTIAESIARTHGVRVSFVNDYGVVYADSAFDGEGTSQLDNHSSRPEIVAAKSGLPGISRRYSDSIQEEMVYVASYSPKQQLFARIAIPERMRDSIFDSMRIGLLLIALLTLCAIAAIVLVANKLSNELIGRERIKQNIRIIEKTRKQTLTQTLISMLNSAVTFDDANKIFYSIMPKLLPNLSGAVMMQVDEGQAEINLVKWGKDWPEDVVMLNTTLKESSQNLVHSKDHRLISARLFFQDKQLGWLQLYDAEQNKTQELLAMVPELTEQISMALHNLQLKCKLRDQAIRDPLTDLYNRRFMYESFEQSLNRAERHQTHLAVLMIDLDHFKRFNDNYGHDFGDEVLKNVAELLRSNLRLEDIACRYGGEEFCIVCPDTNLPDAYKLAEKLRTRVARQEIDHPEACSEQVTISIGVAIYPNHGSAIKNLLALADKALYRAKENGRDCTIVAEPGAIPSELNI